MTNYPFQNQGGGAIALQSFMQRVYTWMAIGLFLTGMTAMYTAGNPTLLKLMLGNGFWAVFLAEIGLVIWLTAMIHKISSQAAIIGFLAYSALNGLTLSFVLLAYTGASVASTFFITAGTFAGVSLFGWTTKSDMTSLRGFFVMGLIGFLIASLVNIFLKSEPFYWILTYFGVALFIGLTAYDTQRLKEIHYSGQGNENMAVIGALKLYLDFINLFLLLLRLFGRRRD